MATSASIIERLYTVIKADICAGVILPGARLSIATYCETLNASKSPVRNALYQLVGEGLLEQRAHDGFYRPRVIEQALYDVLLWNEYALVSAFELVDEARRDDGPFPPLPHSADDLVAGIEHLFEALAVLSGNSACERQVRTFNDQLRPIRMQEADQFPDLTPELEGMMAAWNKGDLASLKVGVKTYHLRRLNSVRQLVALAYRDAR